MPYLDNDGVKIHYEVEGEGPDLFMIHGFTASIENNWRQSNWIDVLKGEHRLILMDCRGHGKSDKPKDPAQYGIKMEEDISKLMDHLSIEKANIFGYSMGSWLSLRLLIREPQRFKCAILGGFVFDQDNQKTNRRYVSVIEALKADNVEKLKEGIGKEYRKFAESMGADLDALAAVSMGFQERIKERVINVEALKKISVPVMTVVGTDEYLPGDITAIAKLVPRACHFQIQGRDHITVVGDSKFYMVVKAFLNYVNSR